MTLQMIFADLRRVTWLLTSCIKLLFFTFIILISDYVSIVYICTKYDGLIEQ